jgi:hypothetical protein
MFESGFHFRNWSLDLANRQENSEMIDERHLTLHHLNDFYQAMVQSSYLMVNLDYITYDMTVTEAVSCSRENPDKLFFLFFCWPW